MPLVSLVIPAYNAGRYIEGCIESLRCQTHRDVEIIVVDDASSDDSVAVVERIALEDSRIRVIELSANSGTLAARKAGILASAGDYVALIDQDDELEPFAIERLLNYASDNKADIYHFGVRVVAENPDAERAAGGMTGFLTPPPRRIEGESILVTQLAEDNGFDWHVHHKLYRGDFIRRAYSLASDERLILADDIYMCFIICSIASAYEAIPDSPWYLYHLGRGDTYGKQMDVSSFERLAAAEGLSLGMAKDYVARAEGDVQRHDWADRLTDLRDRLVFHTMNEWMDSLPDEQKDEGLQAALRHYAPDAVCGEMYRFVRDSAYALYMEGNKSDDHAAQLRRATSFYWNLAKRVEEAPGFDSRNKRYRAMKEIALVHLADCGIIKREGDLSRHVGASKVFFERLRRFIRNLR